MRTYSYIVIHEVCLARLLRWYLYFEILAFCISRLMPMPTYFLDNLWQRQWRDNQMALVGTWYTYLAGHDQIRTYTILWGTPLCPWDWDIKYIIRIWWKKWYKRIIIIMKLCRYLRVYVDTTMIGFRILQKFTVVFILFWEKFKKYIWILSIFWILQKLTKVFFFRNFLKRHLKDPTYLWAIQVLVMKSVPIISKSLDSTLSLA